MCRQTQREWMGGQYPSTSVDGGLSFPKFESCIAGLGVPVCSRLESIMDGPSPAAYVAHIDPEADVIPKNKFGFPLEDSYPHLPRDEFIKNMIVDPV
jgi:hypothetical protein